MVVTLVNNVYTFVCKLGNSMLFTFGFEKFAPLFSEGNEIRVLLFLFTNYKVNVT